MLRVRLTDEQDGYEITTEDGEVLDLIGFYELTTADRPDLLMHRRVESARRRLRVRRFAQRLKELKEEAT